MFTQRCEICGTTFDSTQPAITCSNACKQKRHRLKNGATLNPALLNRKQRKPLRSRKSNTTRLDGYIYIIKDIEITGYYKIGMTSSLKRRSRTFNVKLPFKWEMIHYFFVANMRESEGHLHQLFRDKRRSGEWFELSNEDVQMIKNIGT